MQITFDRLRCLVRRNLAVRSRACLVASALWVWLAPAVASAGDVQLAWDPSPDAAVVGYVVYYGPSPGNYTSSVDVGQKTTHLVAELSAAARVYFVVRGYTADKQLTALSNEVSGMPPFTDHPLVPRVHAVREMHLTELRARINSLRAKYGLTAAPWTTVSARSTLIKPTHITEMRTAVTDVYRRLNRTPPAFTDTSLTARSTVIKAAHIGELRNAVLTLE